MLSLIYNKKDPKGTPTIKQFLPAAVAYNIKLINRREINPRPTIKGVRMNLFVLLFARLAMHGIVYYTFSVYYRVVMSLLLREKGDRDSGG